MKLIRKIIFFKITFFKMCRRHLNCDRLIFMSFGTFLLFTAVNTSNNLLSLVLDDQGFGLLGFYTLALYYLAFGIFSFGGAP
jgi:hypothetical protein